MISEITCDDAPGTVIGANHDILSKKYGGLSIYTCDNGSYVDGSPFVRCLSNGSWSDSTDIECLGKEFTDTCLLEV